ncbi:hypothetical protein MHYP_G00283630 [Metynnis hypsauchen]
MTTKIKDGVRNFFSLSLVMSRSVIVRMEAGGDKNARTGRTNGTRGEGGGKKGKHGQTKQEEATKQYPTVFVSKHEDISPTSPFSNLSILRLVNIVFPLPQSVLPWLIVGQDGE